VAQIASAHDAIEHRRGRSVRTILKLLERSGMRMDVEALLRSTILDEVNALASLSHVLLETVAGDDVIVNDLYVEALEPPGARDGR
jgi:hypothetical protein